MFAALKSFLVILISWYSAIVFCNEPLCTTILILLMAGRFIKLKHFLLQQTYAIKLLYYAIELLNDCVYFVTKLRHLLRSKISLGNSTDYSWGHVYCLCNKQCWHLIQSTNICAEQLDQLNVFFFVLTRKRLESTRSLLWHTGKKTCLFAFFLNYTIANGHQSSVCLPDDVKASTRKLTEAKQKRNAIKSIELLWIKLETVQTLPGPL